MSPFEYWLSQNTEWVWIAVGLILLGLEIVVSGTFLLWFGIAAILVGVLGFLFEASWQINGIIFLVVALGSLIVFRRYNKGENSKVDPLVNQRIARHIGREFKLIESISQGTGRIKIGDTVWRVHGPDLEVGSLVRLVDSDGASLKVEPVQKDPT